MKTAQICSISPPLLVHFLNVYPNRSRHDDNYKEHRQGDALLYLCATCVQPFVCNVCATDTFLHNLRNIKIPILCGFLELSSLCCFFDRNSEYPIFKGFLV